MRAIFISYRRDDCEGHAGRLYGDLIRQFGDGSVFMDVTGIDPGLNFRKVIDKNVSSCGVLLALIGPEWLDAKDETGQRRLDNPMDFVRLETAAALKRDIPVVPVLVSRARMPRPEQLPDDLKELAERNAVELTHARWDSDVQVLVKALQGHIGPPVPRPVTKSWRTLIVSVVAAVAIAAGIGYASYEYRKVPREAAADVARQSPRGPSGNSDRPVHSNGRLIIRGTWSCDLDSGAETSTGADFFWEQATGVKRYLVPKNGAGFFVVGIRTFESVKYADLQRFQYSSQNIDGSNLAYNQIPQGTVVAYRTNEGRLGKLIIDEYGYNLTIRWVTFE